MKELIKTILYQDGKPVCEIIGHDSSSKAFGKLLRLQGQSTDHALKYGGWKVTEFYNDNTSEDWKPYSKN